MITLNPMKVKFKHLSYEERVAISILFTDGWSSRKIAEKLNRHHACIAYELKKNKVKGKYQAKKAQMKAYQRRYLSKTDCLKVAMDPELNSFVEEKLKQSWSPERISGYLKRLGRNISTKAIYKFIYSRSLEHYLFWSKHHVRDGPKKKRFGKPNDSRKYIDLRPEVFSSGHWEGDFIVSRHNSCSLLVLVDRYSRNTLIRKLNNRKHATVLRAFSNMLSNHLVKTITLDNDIAFNCWKKLEESLKCSVYFCHPYHSWEKGLVENTNRWIRAFVPKRTDLRKVSEKDLEEIRTFLNTLPRQCLGFKSAQEVLLESTRLSKLGG